MIIVRNQEVEDLNFPFLTLYGRFELGDMWENTQYEGFREIGMEMAFDVVVQLQCRSECFIYLLEFRKV